MHFAIFIRHYLANLMFLFHFYLFSDRKQKRFVFSSRLVHPRKAGGNDEGNFVDEGRIRTEAFKEFYFRGSESAESRGRRIVWGVVVVFVEGGDRKAEKIFGQEKPERTFEQET